MLPKRLHGRSWEENGDGSEDCQYPNKRPDLQSSALISPLHNSSIQTFPLNSLYHHESIPVYTSPKHEDATAEITSFNGGISGATYPLQEYHPPSSIQAWAPLQEEQHHEFEWQLIEPTNKVDLSNTLYGSNLDAEILPEYQLEHDLSRQEIRQSLPDLQLEHIDSLNHPVSSIGTPSLTSSLTPYSAVDDFCNTSSPTEVKLVDSSADSTVSPEICYGSVSTSLEYQF